MISMPIYLNKMLIQDLHSILINGYLQSTSIKYITDKTDSVKLQKGMEKRCRNEDTYSKKKNKFHNREKSICNRDKESLSIECNSLSDESNIMGSLDGKNTNIREFGITKIYTTFHLFHNLKNMMMNQNMIKQITEKDIINNNIECGDYVEFEANMDPICVVSQLNCIVDTMECYDVNKLDYLLQEKSKLDESHFMNNYNVVLKELKNLNENLKSYNTRDIVVRLKNCSGVLTINTNNFSEENPYMYDMAYCNCKILCKVVKIAKSQDKIDLLRKTRMSGYYNKFLKSIAPHLKLLNDNDIITLNNIITSIDGPAIQALPIAIYV
ncbi:DUF6414 family protein [Clostridium botulinum]|uniref:Uncharacterized protein n=3 Tax=Clostridium botulinum TaxID=1491 RepID=A0A0A2HAN5_CLOBO|nr:hypothetical protein [Clostridium botulinum]EKN35925.1 hypothetical protein CFSAN001627_27485 [Clostridium botulinum CFSAN001627]ACO84701.1 conserved hypothetical protein [Clostridium botulinum A2 str. Kyoto]APC78953.1 hypothetical protein NPD2_358 [Clostridium botulinum]APC83459.1 hypothetical protein NPD12_1920 [Clostridium botulinum]AUN06893.1 hypothetical protein RSJ14_09315 [Clostridium botulinum]